MLSQAKMTIKVGRIGELKRLKGRTRDEIEDKKTKAYHVVDYDDENFDLAQIQD